jgi:UDP-GlcNAc:undecaprenyl-phosphate/decaprenyl-phosphate GlcNAc-1-phosphate transferase
LITTFFIGALIVSLICNELLLRFSQSLGIRNKNDVIVRWSNQSKPSLGGVSFFVVFVFSSIAFSIAFGGDNIFRNLEYVGLLGAASLAFLMGLADDAYNTRPFFKLFIQITCGILFITTGTIIDVTHIFYLDVLLTILWVIGVMNSLNMLDNMDGITGTTVFFILLSCLVGGWMINGINTDVWSITMISMIGALVGFLRFNIHPSKIFMGDAGSQFIGLFVSFFAIKFLWNVGPHTENHSWTGIIITLVAFTPAAADTLTVVINRIKRGQSPMVGGKDHTTHHLVYAGFNDQKVWYIFSLIGIGSSVLALLMIYLVSQGIVLPLLFFAIYFLIIFLILYRNTIKFPEPKK